MHRPDQSEPHERFPEAAGRGFIRRGRRFTPPGSQFPRAYLRRARRSLPKMAASVKLGDVVAELTPRQAVVWLLNLETMVSLYESTTEQRLDAEARERLTGELRDVLRRH